jgi:hypothetical protein
MSFSDLSSLSTSEKLTVLAGVGLALLSLVAVLGFVVVSIHSAVIRHVSRYWNIPFLLCSCSLAAWLIYYALLLRLGSGVMLFRGNVIILLCLAVGTFVSIIFRFGSPQRYYAIAGFIVGMLAFNVVAPLFYALRLLRPR